MRITPSPAWAWIAQFGWISNTLAIVSTVALGSTLIWRSAGKSVSRRHNGSARVVGTNIGRGGAGRGPLAPQLLDHPIDFRRGPLETDVQPADVAFQHRPQNEVVVALPTGHELNGRGPRRRGDQVGQQFLRDLEIGHLADQKHGCLGQRPNHQRHLRDDAQRAQRADHQSAHVVARGVLDHAAAAAEDVVPAPSTAVSPST